MSNAVVISLSEVREVDAQAYLTGPLRRVRLLRLEAGESERLTADTEEHTLYTLNGHGSAVTASANIPLRHGVALTLPLGGVVSVEAASESLEVFVASLAVEADLEAGR
ncbi:hypothetical protein [Amycolatopsis sp. cmx-4-54]|uniref:hypothetical protein n=1 Tax=Amycolatopsis sp. cmx-4-54 TaxID=2790936 RepID=UPI00397D2938